jgi:3-deoxy-manno-octulosonate cytidylyltransferase (CMP-KDO synthetase)
VSAIGIIPARYASTRFPGKPLAMLAGKPMVQWVHERVAEAELLDQVLVATDDERIRDRVLSFGGEVVMTSADHPSGTDRLAEVAAGVSADIIVNIQGDEPLIRPEAIDAVVRGLMQDGEADMATLATPLRDPAAFENRDVVKLVQDLKHRALYFSRAQIPWDRNQPGDCSGALRHVGIYAYRREFLERFAAWEPTELEQRESLEQLRALEHGATIHVAVTEHECLGVDRPEDIAAVVAILTWSGAPTT